MYLHIMVMGGVGWWVEPGGCGSMRVQSYERGGALQGFSV
uniref:Uncharacterized protein n=1 Tax=Anguilla anguilla TaxID=7936 RepID=A0A0E9QCC1_ANGAN